MTTATGTGMAVQILQENLKHGLDFVSRTVAARATLAITYNVAVDTDGGRLRLRATDLDLASTTWCGAKVDMEGGITVPARMFADLIASLPPATVGLTVKGTKLLVECGGRRAELAGLPLEDFPRIPDLHEHPETELPAAAFVDAIRRTEFSAASHPELPTLTGIHVSSDGTTLSLASADRFRLSAADLAVAGPALDVIIPARALREVARMGDREPIGITVNPQRTQVQFATVDREIVAQLIQGTFPNWRHLLPQGMVAAVTVGRGDFASVVRMAAIAARDGAGIIRLRVVDGRLRVSAQAGDSEEWEGWLDCDLANLVEGDSMPKDIHWAGNARYLIDAIDAFPDDSKITFGYTTPSTQALFTSEQAPGFMHIVMPMFVQW